MRYAFAEYCSCETQEKIRALTRLDKLNVLLSIFFFD